MTALPSSLALASVADGSNIVAADHRNNYAAIQTAVNAVIADLGAGAAGQVLGLTPSAITPVYPSGYEIVAATPITTNVTITGTNHASPTLVIATATTTFDGSKCYMEFFSPRFVSPSNDDMSLVLWDGTPGSGGTELDIVAKPGAVAAGVQIATPGVIKIPVTPSAGPHTYKIYGYVGSGTGTVIAGAGGANTMTSTWMRFVKA